MYPAYESFGRQIGRGFAAWRVYMALQPPRLDFAIPRDVKIGALSDELGMGRQHVRKALTELVSQGYLLEHGRDARRVRSLRLAYAVAHAA